MDRYVMALPCLCSALNKVAEVTGMVAAPAPWPVHPHQTLPAAWTAGRPSFQRQGRCLSPDLAPPAVGRAASLQEAGRAHGVPSVKSQSTHGWVLAESSCQHLTLASFTALGFHK